MLNESGKSYGTKGGVATMKTADKSFSSKAMKVLLSIALVIGLAPAISPAKAYAAGVAGLTIGGVAVDGGGGSGYTWDNTAHKLTLTGGTVGPIVATTAYTNPLTIKVAGDTKITAVDAPAIDMQVAGALTIDTTAAALTVETTAKGSTPASAIKAAGAFNLTKGTQAAPAKALTVTSALADENTPVIDATGAVGINEYTTLSAASLRGGAVAVDGTVTGNITATGTLDVAQVAPAAITGNIEAADAVTIGGDAKFAAAITGALTLSAAKATVLGGSSSSGAGAVSVSGLVKTAGAITYNDSATLNSVEVAAGTVLKIAYLTPLATGYSIKMAEGSTVSNYKTEPVTVKLGNTADTMTVPAASDANTPGTYTYANFTAAFAAGKGVYEYSPAGTAKATIVGDIEASKTVDDTNTVLYKANDPEKTALDSIVEAGDYIAAVQATGGEGTVYVPFKVNQGSLAKVRVSATTQEFVPGVPAEPVVGKGLNVNYVTAVDAAGKETLSSENIAPANYALTYANNDRTGTATVNVAFNNASIPTGTLSATFDIITGDLKNYLNDAVVDYKGANVGETAATAMSLGTGVTVAAALFDSITPVGGSDQKANIDYTAYTNAACTEGATKTMRAAGAYYIKMVGNNGTLKGSKTVPFYVADQASLNTGYTGSFADIANATFTGAFVTPVKTPLTFTSKTDATDTIVLAPSQYAITKVMVGSTAADAGIVAIGANSVQEIKVTDTTNPYYGTVVKAAALTNNNFTVVPLDLNDAALNVRVMSKGADYATDKTDVKPIASVYKNAVYAVEAGPVIGSNNVVILANVNGDANTEIAYSATDGIDFGFGAVTPTNAGKYDIVLTGGSSTTAKSIIGSKTCKDAFTITPFDISLKANAAGATVDKADKTYTGLKQELARVAINPGTLMTLAAGVDYEFVTYKKVDGSYQSTPTDAIGAGDYKVQIKALNPNLTGTSYASAEATMAKFAMGSLSATSTDLRASYSLVGTEVSPAFSVFTTTTDRDDAHKIAANELAITYASNKTTGTAKATVAAAKGAANVSGTFTSEYKIAAANDIAGAEVILDKTTFPVSYDANGVIATQKPTLSVKIGTKELVLGKDYTVTTTQKSVGTAVPGNIGGSAVDTYTLAVAAGTGYTGSTTAEYTITKASLANATLADVTNVAYTGTALTVAPVLKLGGKTETVDGTKLKYQYSALDAATGIWSAYGDTAPQNAGKYRVKVVASDTAEDFTGKTETAAKEFSVTPADLSIVVPVVTDVANKTYTGKPQGATVGVTYKSTTLKTDGTEYTVHYYKGSILGKEVLDANGNPCAPTDAGTYYVRVTGNGNYAGTSVTAPTALKIAPMKLTAAVLGAQSVYYTGKAVDLKTLTLAASTTVLTKDVDYTVTYSSDKEGKKPVSPIDAGAYYAKIKAIAGGNFTNTTAGGDIVALTVTKVTPQVGAAPTAAAPQIICDPIAPQLFTGKPIEPAVTGLALKSLVGTDAKGYPIYESAPLAVGTYLLAYTTADHTAVGTGKQIQISLPVSTNFNAVTATDLTTYDIVSADDLALATVAPIADQAYTGKAIEPALDVTTVDGKKLVVNVDYTVVYSNNIAAGKAKAKIIANGTTYDGVKEVTFNITATDITTATIAPIADQAYTGKAI
ncbi:MAG: hypothetical protein RR186_01695, partial [Raoultibacter sp.]